MRHSHTHLAHSSAGQGMRCRVLPRRKSGSQKARGRGPSKCSAPSAHSEQEGARYPGRAQPPPHTPAAGEQLRLALRVRLAPTLHPYGKPSLQLHAQRRVAPEEKRCCYGQSHDRPGQLPKVQPQHHRWRCRAGRSRRTQLAQHKLEYATQFSLVFKSDCSQHVSSAEGAARDKPWTCLPCYLHAPKAALPRTLGFRPLAAHRPFHGARGTLESDR